MSGIQSTEAGDAAKHPTLHRVVPQQRIVWPNVNAEVQKPWTRHSTGCLQWALPCSSNTPLPPGMVSILPALLTTEIPFVLPSPAQTLSLPPRLSPSPASRCSSATLPHLSIHYMTGATLVAGLSSEQGYRSHS